VALFAQEAHDQINSLRDDPIFLNPPGFLGTVDGAFFVAMNDLKNSMAALGTYTGNPNPATLASFSTQYGNAAAEWNAAVLSVWSVAGITPAPTLDAAS